MSPFSTLSWVRRDCVPSFSRELQGEVKEQDIGNGKSPGKKSKVSCFRPDLTEDIWTLRVAIFFFVGTQCRWCSVDSLRPFQFSTIIRYFFLPTSSARLSSLRGHFLWENLWKAGRILSCAGNSNNLGVHFNSQIESKTSISRGIKLQYF